MTQPLLSPPGPELAPFLPRRWTLDALRAAARGCQGCPLYQNATQTVFGEGPAGARVVLVGEKAGDREDIEGRPFVGPAGRELDRALETAGLDRSLVWVTNAVKHFKFVQRGKRRIHQRPTDREIKVCSGWLFAELEAIRPAVIVALGATAAQTLMGKTFKVSQRRGEVLSCPWAERFVATHHPSAILRMIEHDARHVARAELAADIARACRGIDVVPLRQTA